MLPLLGLGLCETPEEVEQIFNLVDDDNSGEIEFSEFLSIITNKTGKQMNKKITNFFQSFVTEKAQEHKSLHFQNYVLQSQRRQLMNAVLGEQDSVRRSQGRKILDALRQ